MATIKSFTSLEQSKKLAEILPLESADMFWRYIPNIHTYDDIPQILVVNNWDDDYNKNIPCWSLASLLRILPKKYTELIKEGGMYRIIIKDSHITSLFNTPVDACVAMIEKLHELNFL